MTNKVQKIRNEVERLQNELIQEKEKGYGSDVDDACILELQNVLTYIDSLQKEPLSSIWHDMSEEVENGRNIIIIDPKNFYGVVLRKGGSQLRNHNKERYVKWAYIDDIINVTNREEPVSEQNLSNVERTGKNWKEEPVSEDLEKIVEEIAEPTILNAYGTKELARRLSNTICGISISEDLGEYINELSKQFPEVSFAKLSRIAVRVAKWQKEKLWKPADGDNLPEIDREVVVLIKYNTQRNIHDEEYPTYRVGFGHRPNPNGWDGKSVTTGKVEHYTPKLYDKGGWNIPNIVYWLDAELPKEIEL